METIYFLLAVFIDFGDVLAQRKEYPHPTDNECLTSVLKEQVYHKFVAGLPPGVEPSDPMVLDKIVFNLPHLKYVLNQPVLTGLKNCEFLKIRVNQKSSSVTYELLCPHLIIKSEYEVKGEINAIQAQGKDRCEITYNNFYIRISGKYERVKVLDRVRFQITNYSLEMKLRAQVTFLYQNLYIRGEGDPDLFGRHLEDKTRNIVMKAFLDKYVKNLQDFQRHVPFDEIKYKYL